MEVLLESLRTEWENLLRLVPRITAGLIVLLLSFVLARIVSGAVARVLKTTRFSPTHRLFFGRLAGAVVLIVGVALSLSVVGLRGFATGLLASGGLTAVVLGFAFREIGENFLAGFFLAFSRPFEVGDFISSEGVEGVVKEVTLRHTHLRTADARDIFLPNAQIFNRPLVNYTRDGLRRPTVKFGIDYGDDPGRACRILLETVKQTKGVLANHPPYVGIEELAAQFVVLEVSFWVDTFNRELPLRQVRSEVMERCRHALEEGGFTFSSDVTTSVALRAPEALPLSMSRPVSPGSAS